jgi:hypothetical protein
LNFKGNVPGSVKNFKREIKKWQINYHIKIKQKLTGVITEAIRVKDNIINYIFAKKDCKSEQK